MRDSCHTGITISSAVKGEGSYPGAETARKPGAAGLPAHLPNLIGRVARERRDAQVDPLFAIRLDLVALAAYRHCP